ncbi:hypothetical protein VY484_004678 [Escherichia coli]|nr:hypothetical protein [Escherichia coli]
MHRIDTKTAQKDKFGAGKNGFTRGNPQTGTPATDLDDDYFDMLQEELCSVVDAPRDKCALSCAINDNQSAFHYLKKNYISGCVMTVPAG